MIAFMNAARQDDEQRTEKESTQNGGGVDPDAVEEYESSEDDFSSDDDFPRFTEQVPHPGVGCLAYYYCLQLLQRTYHQTCVWTEAQAQAEATSSSRFSIVRGMGHIQSKYRNLTCWTVLGRAVA